MGWLSLLFGLADPISKIIANINELQAKKINAQTEQEKMEIQEQIDALKLRRDVIIAESGDKTNRYMRAALAMPVVILMWKIYVWDKTVGSLVGCSGNTDGIRFCKMFTTDALDTNLWWFIGAVAGFYLLTSQRGLLKK